ncbi:MAG: ornithine cyclodeaminase family protein [Desulfobacterales bacterium]|nr:ornithine cyclodeaminase family protein [Desulfobacterales bacterium]
MLILNKQDISLVDRKLIQDAVLNAYVLMNSGRFNMPDRSHVHDGENTLLLMPCFSEKYFATKLVSVFPGAPAKGLPAVNGLMTLADNTSGKPLAVMDGAAVTAERTGAVGGLGGLYLTPPALQCAGILGAGVQGYSQVRYLLLNRSITTLQIYDLFPESAEKMADHFRQTHPEITFQVAESPDELVASSDLVIAATTSTTPLFSNDDGLVQGKTFISIGSYTPEMKEFPDAVIKNAHRVYVDTPFAAKESGDICQPLARGIVEKEKIHPFAGLVQASEDTCQKDGEIVFFKSVGMALFDLSVASALYELAVEEKLGVTLDF